MSSSTRPTTVPPPDSSTTYTVDELAAKTGVPSRTIRFYQAKGVLPAPNKKGRVAVYDDRHVQRLQVVSELQDKGLRLRAIQDLVSRDEVDGEALEEWLGVGERLGNWTADVPQLLTEDELKELLGSPPPGFVAQLIRRGTLEKHGGIGAGARYLVNSPDLLKIASRMERAGIDMDTAMGLNDILEKRLSRMAEELVAFAVSRLGKGFGRSAEPAVVIAAVEALVPGAAGTDAVRIIFTREVERAVREAIQEGRATRVTRRR
jgi:DNA-binding transcriptional MerR regulator